MRGDLTRFYGPLTVLVVVWSFLPLYDDVSFTTDLGSNFTSEYGTLWEMAGNGSGMVARLGLALAAALAVLLAMATFGTTRTAIPLTIAAVGLLLVVLVLSKPGTGDHPPAIADTGMGAVAIGACAFVVAVAHLALLVSANQRARRIDEVNADE